MYSGIGGVLTHQSQEFSFDHLALHHSRSSIIFFFVSNFFSPFESLSNPRHLLRFSTTKNKGRRWCPAISISHPQHATTLKEPPNHGYVIPLSQETTSYHASLMTRDQAIRRSDASCLVETSMAHCKLLLWNPTSFPETANHLWFFSLVSNLDKIHQTPTLASPEMPFKQVLINNIKVFIHEIKCLRKNDIITPSPRSRVYRSFLNPLAPNPPDYRTVVTLLLADEQIHLAFLVLANNSAMEPSSTSLSLLTVAIVSSNASSVDDSTKNRVSTFANLLPSFGLQAVMDPSSNYISYFLHSICFYLFMLLVLCIEPSYPCILGYFEPCFTLMNENKSLKKKKDNIFN
ncbi:hypothetical protein ARALYDRAFT_892672 [Arabidopsis lyrata subsp. lyrata]|uniref:Uncharacterized protein n=1 Tax=Arabidopsis lyrata subsp. lyrata TaxID=81972 RepID=D7KNZ2_ARALL|nr:hypothetical protein ARALYDRAFT_892672 [Arabidopsis lyrata subsp. lyrata]